MYGESSDFQSASVNLRLKLFRAIGLNADTGILKFLCTLFDTYLVHILAKFEPNRMVQNAQNFEVLDIKNPSVINHF